MTKEEILAVEAGRELDDLVADAVGLPKPYFDGNSGYVKPRYSIDISDAWQVVEKLRSMEDGKGNLLLCCLEIFSDYDECWEIRWRYSDLSIYKDGHKTHRSSCFDKFPEAICKAALLAKVKEVT